MGLETPTAILIGAVGAFTASRLGLLPLAALCWVFLTARALPVGVGLTQWYAPYSALALLLLTAGAVWSFLIALGGRSPFGAVHLDDA